MSRNTPPMKTDKGLLISTMDKVLRIAAIVVGAIIVLVLVFAIVSRTSYVDGYWDGMSDDWYELSQDGHNNVQAQGSRGGTVAYGLATANPSVLWGLEEAYSMPIITGPFNVPLVPCSVYLVTTDGDGQQTIITVPNDQVPSKYDGFVAGCNPVSVTPWWVDDQFTERLVPEPPREDDPSGGTSLSTDD